MIRIAKQQVGPTRIVHNGVEGFFTTDKLFVYKGDSNVAFTSLTPKEAKDLHTALEGYLLRPSWTGTWSGGCLV